jgi:hypothetical protein
LISQKTKDQTAEILTSMVKPKLTFFKMQVEGAGSHATETNQACFIGELCVITWGWLGPTPDVAHHDGQAVLG